MSGGTKQLCFDFRALGMIGALGALLMTLSLTADARGIDTWVCTNETDPEKTNSTCSNTTGHGGGNEMNLTCTTAKGPEHKLRCIDTTEPEPWVCMDLGPPGRPWNCTKKSGNDGTGPGADKDGSSVNGPSAGRGGSGGSDGNGPVVDKHGSDSNGSVADKRDNDSNGPAGQTGANIASSTSFCSTTLAIAGYFVYRFAFSIFDL